MKNTQVRQEIVDCIKLLRSSGCMCYEVLRYTDKQRELIDARYCNYENSFSFSTIKQIVAQQNIPEDEIYLEFDSHEGMDGFQEPFIRFTYFSKETDEEYLSRLRELVVQEKLLDEVNVLRTKLEQQLHLKLGTYQVKELVKLVKGNTNEAY